MPSPCAGIERPAARVSYDFVAHWADARVTRVSVGGSAAPCRNLGDRVQCPDLAAPSMRPQIAEVDTSLRQALVTQAVPGGTVVLEYPAVRLGRAIEVGTGLHNVWLRKQAQDPVDLRVVVGAAADATVATVRTRERRRLEAHPNRHHGQSRTDRPGQARGERARGRP